MKKMLTSAFTEQIFVSGKVFELITAMIVAILTYVAYNYGKQGRTWEIRQLDALEAIYDGIGRAAETGRPILMLPGISNLGNPQTLAGLTLFGEISQRSAEIGVDAIASASNTAVITATEAIVRGAYTAAGKPEMYEPGKYVRWFGADQFAYAVGAAGQIMATKPSVILYAGYFLFDVIVSGDTGSRVGAVQIGGTLGSMEMISMMCDHIFIGEELYAASAAITKDEMAIATVAGQDWIKLLAAGLMVLGALFSMAGSDAILNLIGV